MSENFQAIFHLSEIISEVTYEISVVTYPSGDSGTKDLLVT